MKRSTYFMIVTVIVALGGCGSFNNSFNTYPANPTKTDSEHITPAMEPDDEMAQSTNPTTPFIQAAPQTVIVETAGAICATSPWPAPGKFPELPVRAVQAAAGDAYALERVWRQHVDELRSYISERRRLQKEARDEFNEKCKTVSK